MSDFTPARIAVFASGAGSNAARLIEHFNLGKGQPFAVISLVACNKPGAGVIEIANNNGVELLLLEKERFLHGDAYLGYLQEKKIRLIVLAGFLWKIPEQLISGFPRAIVNIHPALLPAYGGKGMYGMNVHRAVLEAGEKQSGITIHYVDSHYDNGDIIFQATCDISPEETPESLAVKVHILEHEYFPREIQKLAVNLRSAN